VVAKEVAALRTAGWNGDAAGFRNGNMAGDVLNHAAAGGEEYGFSLAVWSGLSEQTDGPVLPRFRLEELREAAAPTAALRRNFCRPCRQSQCVCVGLPAASFHGFFAWHWRWASDQLFFRIIAFFFALIVLSTIFL